MFEFTPTFAETKHQLHAKEVVQSLDLAKYDGIVCVSGDGVLVEVDWSCIVAYGFSFMKLCFVTSSFQIICY